MNKHPTTKAGTLSTSRRRCTKPDGRFKDWRCIVEKNPSSMSAAPIRSLPANERYFADALKVHPQDIRPSRHDTDGSRKPPRFRTLQCNARAAMVNGNPSRAA